MKTITLQPDELEIYLLSAIRQYSHHISKRETPTKAESLAVVEIMDAIEESQYKPPVCTQCGTDFNVMYPDMLVCRVVVGSGNFLSLVANMVKFTYYSRS